MRKFYYHLRVWEVPGIDVGVFRRQNAKVGLVQDDGNQVLQETSLEGLLRSVVSTQRVLKGQVVLVALRKKA